MAVRNVVVPPGQTWIDTGFVRNANKPMKTFTKDELEAAMDARCRAIWLEIDSPGGACNGNSEVADKLHAISRQIPTLAYTDGLACSAAYNIAVSCREVWASQPPVEPGKSQNCPKPQEEPPKATGWFALEVLLRAVSVSTRAPVSATLNLSESSASRSPTKALASRCYYVRD